VAGKPLSTLLPGLTTNAVAGGVVETAESGNVFDTSGAHDSVPECDAAQDDVELASDTIIAMGSTQALGDLTVANGNTVVIDATNVGGLNVVDIDRLRVGTDATLVLDGGGDADTVFVVRVLRKLQMGLRSELQLAGGLDASRVVVFGENLCKLGERITGAGTVLCPYRKLSLGILGTWSGALLSGDEVQIQHNGELTHVALQAAQ
jgi:hypothetical protein